MAKGKVIKQWTASSVTEAGEWAPAKLPISLTTGDGVFHIPLPAHVVEYFGPSIADNSGHGSEWKGYSHHASEVCASTLDGVQGLYERVLNLYQNRRRNEVRRKVIVVDFHANVPGQSRFSGTNISEISFASRPALSLSHAILWDINGSLYSVYDRGDEPPQMTYKSKMPPALIKGSQSTFVLDWSAEREAFFDSMRANMARLIDLIAQMLLGETGANIDKLIASGGGFLSLPAPPTT